MAENIIEIAGEEKLFFELENGLKFFYRSPTSREIVNYKNSIKYRRQGKTFRTESAEQMLRLADSILTDVAGLGYRDSAGNVSVLDKNTRPADIAHLKVDGAAPATWRDLVPAIRKIQFIEGVLAGLEDEEKN